MDEFRARAVDLQIAVRSDEAEQLEADNAEYSPAQSRQAIVHMRQDIVMLVSLLIDLNRQAKALRLAVFALVVLALLLLARSW